LKEVAWYAGAYLITSCATQLIFCRFYTFYSSKTVYLASAVLFKIGSVICGAAPNSIAFIIERDIAGMGSAGIQSGNIVLIAKIIPLLTDFSISGCLVPFSASLLSSHHFLVVLLQTGCHGVGVFISSTSLLWLLLPLKICSLPLVAPLP
jgi:MFS family permease